jgi:hypothetical protein
MTDKIIRCRDCKHWKIDRYYTDTIAYKGYNPIDEATGIMGHWIDGVCDISMGKDVVEIDIDSGGFRSVNVITNNNFFCGSAEDK